MSAEEKEQHFNIDDVIEKDREQKKRKKKSHNEVTLRQYLNLLPEDPQIAQRAPSRLLEVIKGPDGERTEEAPEEEQLFGVTHLYPFFSDHLFGTGANRANQEFVEVLEAADKGLPIGKQILLFVGPTASGKSTDVNVLKKGLERYRVRPVYRIKGCPMNEEPLNALPRFMRRSHWDPEKGAEVGLDAPIEEQLGIANIKGDLCHYCRATLIGYTDGNGTKHKGEFVNDEGVFEWWDVPCETFTFSVQDGRGIGSFEPSDEKSQDVSDLVGHENIGVTSNPKYGRDHPQSFWLDGELEKGNRGITEGREFLKKGVDERILWTFINVAEEQEIKVQGSSFPHVPVDTVVIGHCNLTGYKDFSANSAHEALHDRIYVIPFPYPLRVKDEVRVYDKLIAQESNLAALKDYHISPGSLEIAAIFAILTRLSDTTQGLDRLTKLKAYNGDPILAELEDEEKQPIDLQTLVEEGQQDEDIAKREGMFGLSSRDILAALNTAIVQDREQCLTPLKTIRALREVFKHRMGYAEEEIQNFLALLDDDGYVIEEFKEMVVEDVSEAYIKAYDDLLREQFEKYMEEIEYDRARKRKFARSSGKTRRDPVTGKVRESNEKLMRSVEKHVPISDEEADTFRGEVLEYRATDPDFSYETYEPLRQAIKRKALEDAKSSLTLVLATDKPKGEEDKSRAAELFDTLMEKGHCEICAKEKVERASEILNE